MYTLRFKVVFHAVFYWLVSSEIQELKRICHILFFDVLQIFMAKYNAYLSNLLSLK